MMLASSSCNGETSDFWVFGYSSLCWKPGFTYSKCCIGYVKGFSRKFWQGSKSHRGTEAKPGRVATLIKDEEAIVWGCAFQTTSDSSSAFRYLETRECSNGGYLPVTVTFYPADSSDDDEPARRAFPALTFIAYENNPFWLGDAPLPDISTEILESRGTAGHNVEYLLKLTDYLREHIPQDKDDDLFQLEKLVVREIHKRNVCLNALLNSADTEAEQQQTDQSVPVDKRVQPLRSQNSISKAGKVVTGEFAHRVPAKNLRCVNI